MSERTGETRKLRVFVSYAREDGDFVDELVSSLQACGFEAYVDQKDIAPGEGFAQRIEGLIRAADTVIFALSPFSLDSEWCAREVGITQAHSKRVFPILLREIDRSATPEHLAALQEIDFSKPKSFGKGLRLLVDALNTDLDWVREHTRLGDLALRWKRKGDRATNADLLHGTAIDEAEQWLARAPSTAAAPTAEQREYILASRRAEQASAEHERQQIEEIKASQARTQRMQNKFKYALWTFAGVLVLALLATGRFAGYATQLDQQGLAQNARAAARDGNHLKAMRLALSGLPRPSSVNPMHSWSAELESELASAAFASRHLLTIGSPTGRVQAPTGVHFTPDGKRIATTTFDGAIKVWDAANGGLVQEFSAHKEPIFFSAMGSGEPLLITATESEVSVRNLDVTREISPIKLDGVIRAVAHSPNGPLALAISADGSARIHDAPTGKVKRDLSWHKTTITAVGFSSDGRFVATGDKSGAVAIWSVTTAGPPLATHTEHTREIISIAFDKGGERLISTSFDRFAVVWDIAKRAATPLVGHRRAVIGGAFDPANNDSVVTTGADGTARVWDIGGDDVSQVRSLPHTSPVIFARFMEGNDTLVTIAQDQILRVWQVDLEQEARFIGHGGLIVAAAVDRTGKRIATASRDGTVVVWDADAQAREVEGAGDVVHLALLGKGDARVLTLGANRRMQLRPIRGGAGETEVVDFGLLDEKAGRLADITPDGGRVAIPKGRRSITIADAQDGRPLRSIDVPLAGSVTAVDESGDAAFLAAFRFSPDGQSLAVAEDDGTLSAWRISDGTKLIEPRAPPWRTPGARFITHSAIANGEAGPLLAFVYININERQNAGEGQQVSNHSVNLWRYGSSEIVQLAPFDVEVISIALSPDGRRLAVALSNGRLHLVDLVTHAVLAQMKAREEYFRSIAFSADGRYLTTIEGDSDVRIWDVYWATVPRGRDLMEEVCEKKLRNALSLVPGEKAGIWHGGRSAVCAGRG